MRDLTADPAIQRIESVDVSIGGYMGIIETQKLPDEFLFQKDPERTKRGALDPKPSLAPSQNSQLRSAAINR